jgi:uncharacterized protein (DUF1800 family)
VTYGPRPGDVRHVATLGLDEYLERQLTPDAIDDSRAHHRLRRVEAISLPVEDLFALTEHEALAELRRGTILRAVYSERQLLECMVEFWTDHFNIYGEKEGCGRLLLLHDRDVIRRHALGNFRDLVAAVTTSPAMLVFLDGRTSSAGRPNENHARELLELHTLGVGGGYDQRDVCETARALTGWRLREHWRPGQPVFDVRDHDAEAKSVLGIHIDAGLGASDVDRVVDAACAHPSTSIRVARKLCVRFAGESAPRELVDAVARRFVASGLDVREALRAVFRSPEFLAAKPRLKRPYSFAVSALRALGAETDAGDGLQAALRAMSQLPFSWPSPDGFPVGPERWESGIYTRWAYALALTSGAIKRTSIDSALTENPDVAALAVLHRRLEPAEREAISAAADTAEATALVVCVPEFQYE